MTITVIAVCLFAILYGLRTVWLEHEQAKQAQREEQQRRRLQAIMRLDEDVRERAHRRRSA